jgi:hypothetical protein
MVGMKTENALLGRGKVYGVVVLLDVIHPSAMNGMIHVRLFDRAGEKQQRDGEKKYPGFFHEL